MTNWRGIKAEELIIPSDGKVARCQVKDCGRLADYAITRISVLTGNRYDNLMCACHARGWIGEDTPIVRAR